MSIASRSSALVVAGITEYSSPSASRVRISSVDLILGVDRAGSKDSLADTVDYSVVAERAHAVLTGEPVDLIETVAERIVDACRDLPGISFMEVAVHKPQAPIAVPFRDVVVRIRREFR